MTSETLKKAIDIQEEMNKVEHALNMMEHAMDDDDRVVIGIEDNYGDVDVIVSDHKLVMAIAKDVLTNRLQELKKTFESL